MIEEFIEGYSRGVPLRCRIAGEDAKAGRDKDKKGGK
jgi:hypothetical protein